jgi:hypothetical protein
MSYAVELWATAELRDGRAERAGQLYALANRGYREVGYRLWRTDAEEHDQFDAELRAALGERYEQVLAQAKCLRIRSPKGGEIHTKITRLSAPQSGATNSSLTHPRS